MLTSGRRNLVAPAAIRSYPVAMEVNLTPDQQAFVQLAMESGRLGSERDAVAEALALWEERERQRVAFIGTLTDAGESLARGEGRELTDQTVDDLARDIKQRGRARLAAELARTA